MPDSPDTAGLEAVLSQAVRDRGWNWFDNWRQARALLGDLLPDRAWEVEVLAGAIRHGCVGRIREQGDASHLALTREADTLFSRGGFDRDRARWAVRTWARVLGLEPGPDPTGAIDLRTVSAARGRPPAPGPGEREAEEDRAPSVEVRKQVLRRAYHRAVTRPPDDDEPPPPTVPTGSLRRGAREPWPPDDPDEWPTTPMSRRRIRIVEVPVPEPEVAPPDPGVGVGVRVFGVLGIWVLVGMAVLGLRWVVTRGADRFFGPQDWSIPPVQLTMLRSCILREGPDDATTPLSAVPITTRIEATAMREGWYQVRWKDRVGWVDRVCLEAREPVSDVVFKTACTLRAGPGTRHGLLEVAPKGTSFPILHEEGGWLEVDLGEGRRGWAGPACRQ